MKNPAISTAAPSQNQTWDHLLPIGDFPGQGIFRGEKKKRRIVQRVTREEVGKIATALNRRAVENKDWPGIYLDVEHESNKPGGSTAAATWYRTFEAREDGLYGKAERTALGDELIGGKIYKRISPVSELDAIPGEEDVLLVTGLSSAGLTNKPNMRALRTIAENREPESLFIEPTPKEPEMKLTTQTLKVLGISAEATAEEVEAKVIALNSLAEDRAAQILGIEADAAAKEHADKFKGGEDAAKTMFCENREAFDAVVENHIATAVPDSEVDDEGKPRVLNSADANTPAATAIGDDPVEDAKAQRAAQVRNRATALCEEKGLGWDDAWATADREIDPITE